MKRLPDFTDEELGALRALLDAAVRGGGIDYVPNAYMMLGKLGEVKEVKPPKEKK